MKKLTLDALLQSINEDSNVNSLIQSSPVCHKIFDPDFKLKFMSNSGVAALQIENVEDYYGQPFPNDSAPKITREIFNETMHRASMGETNTIEYSFEVDGNVIWFRTTISPFFDTDGHLIYINADSMDITSTKKAEETNRTILETTNICLKEIHKNDGPGYTLIFMSPAGQEQLGITNLEELYGGPYPPDFYPDEAKRALTEVLDRVVSTGESAQLESELFDTHGNSVWFLSTFSVQRKNEAGKVVSITGSSQDITENVINLAALAKSKELAEKANQAKSEFLSRMSHELRTPMNSILGFTQLLLLDSKNPLTSIQKESLEMVSAAGDHLLQLINEVLDLTKIESGSMALNIKPTNLKEIVDEVLSISQPIADKHFVSLEQHTIDDSAAVLADNVRLKEVLLNLVSNAIKYNKTGGSVMLSTVDLENGNLGIQIKDTGRGIPDNQKKHIFEAFHRAHINQANIEGTGIGLTISKKLIEAMGGTIGFDSVFGEGSCFYVGLPTTTMNSNSSQQPGERVSGQNDVATASKNKLLYIEDIPANMALVKKILSVRPHIQLIAAINAQEGIALAESMTPDLILMDIHLPDMDGLEAFKKLQTNKETKDIPVIALTADAMNSEIKTAMNMGFHSYITKPINIPNFLNRIDGVLS